MVESEMIEKVAEYKKELEYVTKRMTQVNYEINFGEVTENTVDYLNTTLDDHIKNLFRIKDELLNNIDSFSKDIVGVSRKDINDALDNLKRNYKNLKNGIKERYNRDVIIASKKLEEIKNNPEYSEEVNDVFVPALSTKKVRDYRTRLGLDELNYKTLGEVNGKISEINEKMNKRYDEEVMDFEAGLEQVSIMVAEISNDMLSINNIEASVKKEELEDEVITVKNMVSELEIKLANLKDRMDEEVYNSYFSDLAQAYSSVKKLDKELDNIQVKIYDDQVRSFYNYTKNEIIEANKEFKNYYDNIISTFEGYFDVSAVTVIDKKVAEFDEKIVTTRKAIENALNDGKIDEQLYNNLNKYLSEAEKTVSMIKSKKDDPKTYKANVQLEVAGINMNGLENALLDVETMLDKLDAPIKKADRKVIEKKINDIQNKIKGMEVYFEENKDDKGIEKLSEYKERLEKIVSVYRKKCPFLVKSVKSAKDFYKKHKKVVLVAAGLATVALVHATVGPVIIPAIMQGNLMLKHTLPSLTGFFDSITNVLGNMINASMGTDGYWYAANGMKISPNIATTSLLKGVALSGIGSAAIVAPLVVGVKNLVQKMNMTELKNKLNNGKEKVVEVSKKSKTKTGDKITVKTAKLKEDVKKTTDTIKEKVVVSKSKGLAKVEEAIQRQKKEQRRRKLIKELKNSKMSLEEFAKNNKLTELEKGLLTYYNSSEEETLVEGKSR